LSLPDRITTSVLLAFDPNSPIGSLVEQFASKIVGENGRTILHFWCTSVDHTSPHYLSVTAFDPKTGQEAPYLIPHHLVAFIVQLPLTPEIVKKIGFV
jgi:hypothetical protein